MRRPLRTHVLAAVAIVGTGVLTASLLGAPAHSAEAGTRVSGKLSVASTNPDGVVVMSGTVKDEGDHVRKIVLEQRIASDWRRVATTASDATGAYDMPVPTTWFYSSGLRTRVVRTRHLPGDTSRTHRLTVVPAYTPLGSPDSWARLSTFGDRLDPCRTVTYGINTSRATPDAASVTAGIQATMALVAQATGVRFEFVGETGAMPFDKMVERNDPRLVFAFTTDAETRLDLGPSVAARGGSDRTRWARNVRGQRILETVRGGVLYDLDDTATMTADQFEQLTLHEVGHVMGLGHIAATDQYMTPGPELYELPLAYQAGDLHGLSRVGLQAGCVRPLRAGRREPLDRMPVPVATTVD